MGEIKEQIKRQIDLHTTAIKNEEARCNNVLQLLEKAQAEREALKKEMNDKMNALSTKIDTYLKSIEGGKRFIEMNTRILATLN